MNLILWRHAEAHAGEPDLARELTHKGHAQAAAASLWLRSRLPVGARILVSPARRSVQTADALGHDYELCSEIAPERCAADLLHACGWPNGDTVVLVGHQPALGRLAALLMTGAEADWSIRKGAFWWLVRRRREEREQVVLHAALTPGLLDRRDG